jgi:(1->4)-alpha-D-glucan 1-alpha-D-glucosylmutase
MLQEWMGLNQSFKSSQGYPQPNEEQFLYQTLLCVWEPETSTPSPAFVDRIEAYMMKVHVAISLLLLTHFTLQASKEAKVFTSWTEPDEAFETALKSFIRKVVANECFLRSFVPFAHSVHRSARLTCISHTILHITLPGVPDVYQGTEKWDLSLVDPDNRRPPDYASRKELVNSDIKGSLLLAVEADKDGVTKMWTLRTMLKLRKQLGDLLTKGSYSPAMVTGPASERVVAFARKHGNAELIVIVGTLLQLVVLS